MHVRPEEAVKSLPMGVTGSSVSTDIGAENSIQVFQKNREGF